MPIQMRILPQVCTFWKTGANFFYFIHSNGRLKYISFHMSGKCVMILSIFDSILKFSWKSKKYKCLELILIGWIRIGMTWIPILIRILQNYADLTLSGSNFTILVILDGICKNMIILSTLRENRW
jgi:hypothetical protein